MASPLGPRQPSNVDPTPANQYSGSLSSKEQGNVGKLGGNSMSIGTPNPSLMQKINFWVSNNLYQVPSKLAKLDQYIFEVKKSIEDYNPSLKGTKGLPDISQRSDAIYKSVQELKLQYKLDPQMQEKIVNLEAQLLANSIAIEKKWGSFEGNFTDFNQALEKAKAYGGGAESHFETMNSLYEDFRKWTAKLPPEEKEKTKLLDSKISLEVEIQRLEVAKKQARSSAHPNPMFFSNIRNITEATLKDPRHQVNEADLRRLSDLYEEQKRLYG